MGSGKRNSGGDKEVEKEATEVSPSKRAKRSPRASTSRPLSIGSGISGGGGGDATAADIPPSATEEGDRNEISQVVIHCSNLQIPMPPLKKIVNVRILKRPGPMSGKDLRETKENSNIDTVELDKEDCDASFPPLPPPLKVVPADGLPASSTTAAVQGDEEPSTSTSTSTSKEVAVKVEKGEEKDKKPVKGLDLLTINRWLGKQNEEFIRLKEELEHETCLRKRTELEFMVVKADNKEYETQNKEMEERLKETEGRLKETEEKLQESQRQSENLKERFEKIKTLCID